MLASLLGGHPECVAPPECQFKLNLACEFDWTGEINKETMMAAIAYLNHSFRFLIWDVDLEPEAYFQERNVFDLRSLLEHVVHAYATTHHNKVNPKVWFDHDPHSLRDHQIILNHFPDARFIHIARDGRAVAASLMPLDYGPNTVCRTATFWKKRIQNCLEVENKLSGDQVTRVRYEDLVAQPEEELKRLCSWLSIEYTDGMLEAKGIKIPEYTRLQHEDANKPPDPSKTAQWRQTLSRREIKYFEYFAGDTLASLGYEREFLSPSPPGRFRSYLMRKREKKRKQRNIEAFLTRKKWGLKHVKRPVPPFSKIVF